MSRFLRWLKYLEILIIECIAVAIVLGASTARTADVSRSDLRLVAFPHLIIDHSTDDR